MAVQIMKSANQSALRGRIRETTMQAILAAAEEVFADKGLHAAHMGEIAAQAGVAVGTLYNHFTDREALLSGLLVARRAELLDNVDAALREAAPPAFPQRLRALLLAVLTHAQAHRKFFHILMQGEIGRYAETFPSACTMPTATMREVFTRVDKLMKQGVRERAVRADLGDLAPVLFMGMVRGLVMRDVVLNLGGDLVGQADRLLTFFIEGAGT
jgi:AcrR family transcriptional regulator